MTDRASARGDLVEAVDAAVSRGVDWVQVRERDLEANELLALAERVAEAARAAAKRAGREVRILVNRRADVALAIGADGVHLGFDALGPAAARRLLGPEALVGVSCHTAHQVRTLSDASYAQLAPIFAPLSKPAERPALGLAALGLAEGPIPVLAQGGIEASNAADALAAGAAGAAVTGAILGAGDPGAAAAALREALDRGAGSRLAVEPPTGVA